MHHSYGKICNFKLNCNFKICNPPKVELWEDCVLGHRMLNLISMISQIVKIKLLIRNVIRISIWILSITIVILQKGLYYVLCMLGLITYWSIGLLLMCLHWPIGNMDFLHLMLPYLPGFNSVTLLRKVFSLGLQSALFYIQKKPSIKAS